MEFNLMFECEDCKEKISVSSDNAVNSLKYKKEFNVNGKSIFLTYYDCQSCGRRHFVQIDDTNSLEELKSVTNEFYKLCNMRRQGKEISKKQSAKFGKARQHLSEYRMKLMKKYTGKSIHDDETDSDFVLRFSV